MAKIPLLRGVGVCQSFTKNSPPWTIENESSKIASVALRGRGGLTRYSTKRVWRLAPTKRHQLDAGARKSSKLPPLLLRPEWGIIFPCQSWPASQAME